MIGVNTIILVSLMVFVVITMGLSVLNPIRKGKAFWKRQTRIVVAREIIQDTIATEFLINQELYNQDREAKRHLAKRRWQMFLQQCEQDKIAYLHQTAQRIKADAWIELKNNHSFNAQGNFAREVG